MLGVNNIQDNFQRKVKLTFDLPKPNWTTVGTVSYLYKHLIMGGAFKKTYCIDYTFDVPYTANLLKRKFRDEMFVVYDTKTRLIQDSAENDVLFRLEVTPINTHLIMLHYLFMRDNLIVNLHNIYNNIRVDCYRTLCDQFVCSETIIDCGSEAAVWISKVFNNKHLRLGYCCAKERKDVTFWENYCKLRNKYKDENDILLNMWDVPIVRTILMKSNCDAYSRPIVTTTKYFHPKILINTNSDFQKKEWDWIKVGEAIFKNVKPWNKTNANLILRNVPQQYKNNLQLNYWELRAPGCVKISDEVMIHVPEEN